MAILNIVGSGFSTRTNRSAEPVNYSAPERSDSSPQLNLSLGGSSQHSQSFLSQEKGFLEKTSFSFIGRVTSLGFRVRLLFPGETNAVSKTKLYVYEKRLILGYIFQV